MVVSHDRDFLNSVTTDIIHLHDQRLHGYRGNFAQFEDMYEQKRKEVNKVADKFEKQMKAAKKSGSKASQDKVRCCSALCCLNSDHRQQAADCLSTKLSGSGSCGACHAQHAGFWSCASRQHSS